MSTARERKFLIRKLDGAIDNLIVTPVSPSYWQCPESGGKTDRHILPYRKANKTRATPGPQKGGYSDGERILLGIGIDHVRLGLSLEEVRGQPLELFTREGGKVHIDRSPEGRGNRVPLPCRLVVRIHRDAVPAKQARGMSMEVV